MSIETAQGTPLERLSTAIKRFSAAEDLLREMAASANRNAGAAKDPMDRQCWGEYAEHCERVIRILRGDQPPVVEWNEYDRFMGISPDGGVEG